MKKLSAMILAAVFVGASLFGCGGGGSTAPVNVSTGPTDPGAPPVTPPTTPDAAFISMPLSSINPTTINTGGGSDIGTVVFFKSVTIPGRYTIDVSIGNDVNSAVKLLTKTVTNGVEGRSGTGNSNSIHITRTSTNQFDVGAATPVDISAVDKTKPVFGFIKSCVDDKVTVWGIAEPQQLCASETYERTLP